MTEVLRTLDERFLDLPGFPTIRFTSMIWKALKVCGCTTWMKALKMLTAFFCVCTASRRGVTFTGK